MQDHLKGSEANKKGTCEQPKLSGCIGHARTVAPTRTGLNLKKKERRETLSRKQSRTEMIWFGSVACRARGFWQVIASAQKIRLISHTVRNASRAVIRTPRAPRIRPATRPILVTDFGKRR